MFALFGKLFRSRRPAAPHPDAGSAGARLLHDRRAGRRTDDRQGIYRGLSGDAIAIVKNLDQALTLQDTLNLANGHRPSRRLLDAIYHENSETAESATRR